MNTHIKTWQDQDGIHFSGTITTHDLTAVRLDKFERKMLSRSPEAAADVALDLHTLLFRICQQNTTAPAPGQEGGGD